jgi:hypothetical protein
MSFDATIVHGAYVVDVRESISSIAPDHAAKARFCVRARRACTFAPERLSRFARFLCVSSSMYRKTFTRMQPSSVSWRSNDSISS